MLSEQAQTVLSVLQTAHIEYHVKEHIPVYTIDEMSALHLPDGEAVAKTCLSATIRRGPTTSSSSDRKKRPTSRPCGRPWLAPS